MDRNHNDDVFFNPFTSASTTPTATDSANASYSPAPKITDRFMADSSSSDEDGDGNDDQDRRSSRPSDYSYESTSKRLDYMIQFLDRKLSVSEDQNDHGGGRKDRPLPEFVAKGGGTGIFRLPVRAAVHPNRPPSLEVRPHPLRETQTGRSLRTIAATEGQLWAGGESGVRVWDFRDLYSERSKSNCNHNGMGMEEEDTAPYRESVAGVLGTVCMVGDEASRGGVVWSGHRDGRIRCWRMEMSGNGLGLGFEERFKELFSWQAHRGPVLSLVMTCHGEFCNDDLAVSFSSTVCEVSFWFSE